MGLFAGGETAVVVAVEFHDAPPQAFESRAITLIAREPIQLGDALNGVQAFPPRLAALIELLAGERGTDIISCPAVLKFIDDLACQVEIRPLPA